MAESSCVHGLRHQARCLTSVKASTEESQFLVGTVGAKDNGVCLLKYDDEQAQVKSTMYAHADEVWDIASCPANEDLFFTTHSQVSSNPRQRKATLWRKPEWSREGDTSLVKVISLEQEGIKRVLWDPIKENNKVVSLDPTHIRLHDLDHVSTIVDVDVGQTFESNPHSPSLDGIQNAVWNPHGPDVVAVGAQCLAGWDLRSKKSQFVRKDAHKSTIRAVDYNANKPFHVATGGDDAEVRIWDIRHLDEPIMVVSGHTHWVWSVAFNTFHDQLLLTSSSDTLVNLHNVVSVSSASYLRNEQASDSIDTDAYWNSYTPTDGLICTFDQHEDSVYSAVWSPADTWTFASLSYAGRIVISQAPPNERFKIMGV
ncbi:WD40-repeat-containing domain protein [Phycomyces nitens]|nr:WD40-repeat-containing domain protein [Phycomyces nitens]